VFVATADFTMRGRVVLTRYTGKTLNSMKKLKNGKKAQRRPKAVVTFKKDTTWSLLRGKW
jgi:hypothetical protein